MEQQQTITLKPSQAQDMLERLGFKNVLRPAIVSAVKVTNGKFKEILLKACNSEHNREDNLRYIASCLCLSTKRAIDFFIKHQISFNHDQLVAIGIREGMEIRDLMQKFESTGDSALLNAVNAAFHRKEMPLPGKPTQPSESTESASFTGNEKEKSREDYRSIHFYGKDTALCFSASMTRGGNHTINIDAAKLSAGGNRNFDWKNAVHFQFTPKELFSVVSVLMNTKKMAEFKSHGANNDKGFSIERQDGKYYLKLFSKEGGSRAVPVLYDDAVNLAFLVIDQIALEHSTYRKPELLAVVRMVMA